MADNTSSEISVDEESRECLEVEVKKGRPRKFFLVYKGANIKTLEVFRKGPFGSRVMKAKKAGYVGDVAYGIVVGSGKELDFFVPGNDEVAKAIKAEGYLEKEPVKQAKFREYLKKNEFQFKPTFKIVTSLGDLPTLEGEEEAGGPAESAEELAALFRERLGGLLPQIKAAIGTPGGDEAKQLAGEAGALAKQEQLREALGLLDQVEESLATVSPAESDPAPAADGPSPADKLNQALASLTPAIKQAVAAAPAEKNDILQPAAEIKKLIAASDFRNAAAKIKEYKSFLDGFGGGESTDLLPLWRDAKDEVDRQLEQFRSALIKTGDPYLTKIATGGVEAFVAGPGREYVSLQTSLMDLKNAAGDQQKKLATKLVSAVQAYQQYLATNAFIEVCDSNRLCGPMTIRDTLTKALGEIEKSAGSLAA